MDASDFSEERNQMVDAQLAARGINDRRVLAAMRKVPRHLFVPADLRPYAYEDHPLAIGHGQTISQPYMVGIMTEVLGPGEGDRVLEIGTGSGYQSAVLAELSGEVVTVERNEMLAGMAADRLAGLGYSNVRVMVGDGSQGWPELGPYDRVMVTAASPRVPEPLKAQLKEGGRLVCPVGSRELQTLWVVTRTRGAYETGTSINCVFVPLVGRDGWAEK
ncbi:MAG: protein-L-isoaspartate(D-aspartate) O-methyltransferase [Candidatus Hydrogenedentes bacterium]|nr:protein-L-isoaspartate(D-aspartate) O-methyltransferase [Candidatus Hydrogenedentota bacterium]